MDAMLALDQAPGSQQLRRLKAQLLFQLSRWESPASTVHNRPVQSS